MHQNNKSEFVTSTSNRLIQIVEYDLGKLPFKIQTFVTHLFYNIHGNNFNQKYGTRFGFRSNVIAADEVVVLI